MPRPPHVAIARIDRAARKLHASVLSADACGVHLRHGGRVIHEYDDHQTALQVYDGATGRPIKGDLAPWFDVVDESGRRAEARAIIREQHAHADFPDERAEAVIVEFPRVGKAPARRFEIDLNRLSRGPTHASVSQRSDLDVAWTITDPEPE